MNERLLRGEQPGPGRPKGSKNKVSEGIRSALEEWVEGKLPELDSLWKEVSPKDRVRMMGEVLPYVLPRLASTDTNISFEKLSDEDLDAIIQRLTDGGEG